MNKANILNESVVSGRKTIENEKELNIRNNIGKNHKEGEIATTETFNKSKNMKTNLDIQNKAMKTSLDIPSKAMRTGLRKENIDEGIEKSNVCPFCGSADFLIDYSRSEVSCKSCGVVLEENIIDFSPSGTSINRDGQNLNQNGAPCSVTKHDGGLTTDFKLKDVPKHDLSRWKRIHRLHNQSKVWGSHERNLSRAFNELSLLISQLSLPKDVKKEASAIYRKAVENDLVRGRSITLVMSASLYAACRRCKVPRTLDEIAEVSGNSKKSVAKNYRFLSRELSLKLRPTSPTDYIPRFASMLGLSHHTEVRAIELINDGNDLGLFAGKTPTGVAAAALYCACILLGERRTQGEIASVVGVTEVTIRTRFQEMNSGMNLSI